MIGRGYQHTAGDCLVNILLAELPRLLPHYLLGFTLDAQGAAQPVALLGLAEGNNLYLHPDGRWLADYVPAAPHGYSFALVQPPQAGLSAGPNPTPRHTGAGRYPQSHPQPAPTATRIVRTPAHSRTLPLSFAGNPCNAALTPPLSETRNAL